MTTAHRDHPERLPLLVRFAALLGAVVVTLLAGCGSAAQDPASRVSAAREEAARATTVREEAFREAEKWVLAARDAQVQEDAARAEADREEAAQNPAARDVALRRAEEQKKAKEEAEREATSWETRAWEAAAWETVAREAVAWETVGREEAQDDTALTGVLLGAVAVAGLAGAALLITRRRRRPPAFSFSGHGSVATPFPVRQQAPAGQRPASAPSGAADVPVLATALREVAAVAPGAAIGQQIRRLLDTGAGRGDLLLACIRYRDQLAERDPAIGARLLAALRGVGVEEVRVDGALFDAHHHESVDVTAAPRPELHDHVAQTTRIGYLDGARVVRLPQVVVYRFAPPGARGGQS